MRFLFIVFSVILTIICIMMQQQSVEAKPFIFFLPQAPPRSDSNLPSPSTSLTSNIDFTSILTNKLNLLTSLLQSGLNSGGFTFGFNKVLPNVQAAATAIKMPNINLTTIAPDTVFKPESIASVVSNPLTSSTATTVSPSLRILTTTTTESYKNTEKDSGTVTDTKTAMDKNINDNIDSEVKNSGNKVTTDKSGNEFNTREITSNQSQNTEIAGHTMSKIIDGRNNNNGGNDNDNSDMISRITADKTKSYEYSTPKIGYSYDSSNHAMTENEISNEIMMINNQYLPPF